MRNYINYFLGVLSVASFFSGIAYIRLHYVYYLMGTRESGIILSDSRYYRSEDYLLYSVVLFIISISIGIYLWKNNFFTRNK
jgi:hypothetical protein